MARQAGDLAGQRAKGAPAARGQLLLRVREAGEVVGDRLGAPAVSDAGEPFEVGVRQAERLADVADGAARPVGREGGDERRVLAAVALGDGDDQSGADVPREVEVDVGDRRQLTVEEATEREVRLHRIDVRETRQVADDRADRAAPPPARRQRPARRVAAAHPDGDLTCQLEHLPVQQEEAGKAELRDQSELFLQALPGLALVAVGVGVALGEGVLGEGAQLGVGRLDPAGEVGVAVAELLGQVEAEALGQLAGAMDGGMVAREALEDLGGRQQDALAVAAPLLLRPLQRGAVAQRDEDVLQRCAPAHVAVHVAGDDGLHPERLGQVAQRRQPPRVPALVGALQLDEEPLPPERRRQPLRRRRVAQREPVARAAGEADEPLVPFDQRFQVERRRVQLLLAAGQPRQRVRLRQQAAERRVAALALDEQRDVGGGRRRGRLARPDGRCRRQPQRHLRTGDRPHAERLRRVGELERAVDAVVVGEGERRVAEVGGAGGQLVGLRGAVEERVGGVAVQLDVGHQRRRGGRGCPGPRGCPAPRRAPAPTPAAETMCPAPRRGRRSRSRPSPGRGRSSVG